MIDGSKIGYLSLQQAEVCVGAYIWAKAGEAFAVRLEPDVNVVRGFQELSREVGEVPGGRRPDQARLELGEPGVLVHVPQIAMGIL